MCTREMGKHQRSTFQRSPVRSVGAKKPLSGRAAAAIRILSKREEWEQRDQRDSQKSEGEEIIRVESSLGSKGEKGASVVGSL